MQLGLIADLHIDLNAHYSSTDYLHVLSHYIQQEKLDLFVIAGDISNHYSKTLPFITALEQMSACQIAYVPGNHDLWEEADTNPKQTEAIWARYLHDPHCLITHPRLLGAHTALCGHTGWYNYAYAASRFTQERLATGRYKIALWQDKRRLAWPHSDPQISKIFAEQLRADLDQVADHRIILVTHLVTHPALVPKLPDRRFDFYNAYLATSDIYPYYQQYPIETSVMGHLHVRATKTLPNLTLHCCSLGYYQQWQTPDLTQEIAHAVVKLRT